MYDGPLRKKTETIAYESLGTSVTEFKSHILRVRQPKGENDSYQVTTIGAF